ncbi:MAG: NAD-dependent epimerase/dehydratase family protein [Alcanivoracaceae bacterium]|nr:NAD-dependent epimerase/dehydratase family protein [Alcanivoracaceae bacterium]
MNKNNQRRQFIKNSLIAAMGVPFVASNLLSCTQKGGINHTNTKKLYILILGGTSFLGPHQIKYALSRGHSVSIFTRGKTKPIIYKDMFENVESLVGDRENDLSALKNRKWDVVIDNSGRDSEWTKKSAQLLKDNADLYLYISSTGVYYPYLKGNINEETSVLLSDPVQDSDSGQEKKDSYGVMKAKSELETIAAFGKERSIIVRPTYMIGPADMTHRFIHWPIRLARGGEILIPGKPEDLVQYIDVRDVAEWTIRLCEQKTSGTYNAVGPKKQQGMYDFIQQASQAFDVKSTFIQVDDYEFLMQNKVYYIVPWLLPDVNYYGSARISTQKVVNAGLSYRDLKKTVLDTHDWWYSDSIDDEIRSKYENNPLSLLMREKELLKQWKNK